MRLGGAWRVIHDERPVKWLTGVGAAAKAGPMRLAGRGSAGYVLGLRMREIRRYSI